MTFSEFLLPQNIFPKLRALNKEALLRDLAEKAAASASLPADTIRQALLRREQLGSTGVGMGIAIPHARLTGITKPIGVFARLERPIEFGSIDNSSVDLVFLLLTPESEASNLPQLAVIARTLRDPAKADGLRKAKDPVAILHVLESAIAKD